MGEIAGLLVLLAIAALLLVLILTVVLVREARRPPRHTMGYALGRGLPVDPREMGLPFESWTLHRPGGVELPVWDVTGESPHRGGPAALTAVFVHGWGQSRIDMLGEIRPWRELASRLILYDLRGHGEATGPSRLGNGEDEDLLALVETLDDARVVLVGYSMGAVIALAAAASGAASAQCIAGVVAHGPYCEFHRSLQGRLRRAGLPARPMTDLAMLWLGLTGLHPLSAWSRASSIRCPLLVVHGSDDPVCPIEHARRIVGEAADGELLEVAGAAHLDAAHVDPAAHEAAVRRFVERLRGPASAGA